MFYLLPLVNTYVTSGFLLSIISMRAEILSVSVNAEPVGESLAHSRCLVNTFWVCQSIYFSSSQQRHMLGAVISIFKKANWRSAWALLLSDYSAPAPPLPSMSALLWALGGWPLQTDNLGSWPGKERPRLGPLFQVWLRQWLRPPGPQLLLGGPCFMVPAFNSKIFPPLPLQAWGGNGFLL